MVACYAAFCTLLFFLLNNISILFSYQHRKHLLSFLSVALCSILQTNLHIFNYYVIDVHLSCLHFLTITNNAAIYNVHVHNFVYELY